MTDAAQLDPWHLVRLADAIRDAQRAYMADRGNHEKGKAVASAAEAYDSARSAFKPKDACAKCGFPRREHSYNGACYGICGDFEIA